MNNIQDLRQRKGLSQAELAQRVGVDPSAVSKWESAGIYPKSTLLPKIADALDCKIDEIFGR